MMTQKLDRERKSNGDEVISHSRSDQKAGWRYVSIALVFFAVCVWAAGTYLESRYGSESRVSNAPIIGPSREVAFVSNAVGGTVSIIDIETARILHTINVIPDGRRVGFLRDPVQWIAQPIAQADGGLNFSQDTDVSRDGTMLFVSRGFLADVAAFDIATGQLIWRTMVAGIRADHMTISPDGERLYVSAIIYGGNVVEVLDTRDGSKIGELQAGQWPHDVHTSNDGSVLYTASLGDMQIELEKRGATDDAYVITVHDAATFALKATHHFSEGVRPFRVTGDASTIYAQLSNHHSVISYNLLTAKRSGQLELPVAKGITQADWDFEAPHHGLALSPDESTLCLAGRASDYAALVNAADLSLLGTVPVGDAPSWSEFAASGKLCVLANSRGDDVSFVSVSSMKEMHRVKVGRGPKHITIGNIPSSLL